MDEAASDDEAGRQHPPARGAIASCHIRVLRRLPSRRGGASRRAAGNHALGGMRGPRTRLPRESPSNPTPSMCRTATSGPRPASRRESTSHSRWSPTTTAAKPPPPSLAALSSTSAAPADRRSSQRCSPRSPRMTNPSATCSTGSPTTSPPTCRSRRWRCAPICPIGSSVVCSSPRWESRPAEHVEAVRMEAACRLLETTLLGMEEIARACGFGTPETMNRAFRRRLNTTPGDHRHHFGPVCTGITSPGAHRSGQMRPRRESLAWSRRRRLARRPAIGGWHLRRCGGRCWSTAWRSDPAPRTTRHRFRGLPSGRREACCRSR